MGWGGARLLLLLLSVAFYICDTLKVLHHGFMISSSVCVHAQLLSRGWLCETPWTAGRQWLLSMEFSRQDYWIRMSFPPPGHLPNPGTEPKSLVSPALAGRFFTTEQSWKSIITSALKTILLQISKIRYYCSIYTYIYIYIYTPKYQKS